MPEPRKLRTFKEGWEAEQARQKAARADPGSPKVVRQARLIGLAMVTVGVVLGVALGAAFWLADMRRAYGWVLALPLSLFGIGVWMLVTGRHPQARKRRRRDSP